MTDDDLCAHGRAKRFDLWGAPLCDDCYQQDIVPLLYSTDRDSRL